MKIKEVEREVGISSKNIRFYEEEGLIKVKRDRNNAYRDFTDEDVKRLKEIKLFRNLGVSLEDIRKYMRKEFTLQEVMDHRIKELNETSDNVRMMMDVCKKVKEHDKPLVSFLVNQYEKEIDHHHKVKKSSKMLGIIGEGRWSRRNMLYLILLCTPILYFILVHFVNTMYSYAYTLSLYQTHKLSAELPFVAYPSIIIILCISMWIFIRYFLHMTYFEFCEDGIYFINHDTKTKDLSFFIAILKNNPYPCYDYVSYSNIEKVKFTFQSVGRITGGDEIYESIFVLYTKNDEVIRIDSGVLGKQENVKMIAHILKEKAKVLIDPYHLFEALNLTDEKFYAYLENLYEIKHPPYRKFLKRSSNV